MVEIHGKWSRLSNTDSNHFGKLGCKRAYIEYGGDTGFHIKGKGRFPLSNRIQESKIVGWGKTKKVFTCCLVTKSKTGRVSKLTNFLFLCVLKSTFFSYRKGYPPRMVEIHGKWSGLGKCWLNQFWETRLQTWKNLYGNKLEKWRNCMDMWRIYRENEETHMEKVKTLIEKGK